MAHFTFVEFETTAYEARTFAMRGSTDTLAQARKLDRFRKAAGLAITAIYAVEANDMPAAIIKLQQFVTYYRNPERPERIMA